MPWGWRSGLMPAGYPKRIPIEAAISAARIVAVA